MKHDLLIIGFIGSESVSILNSFYERRVDLSGIIILESTRPVEPRVLDEIILQRVRMEPLNLVHRIEVPFIAKPTKRVCPQDHLTSKKRHRMSHVKQGSRKYLKRPF